MLVEGPKFGLEYAHRQHDNLRALIGELAQAAERLCPDCDLACACSASTSCACDCAPDCEDAPRMMTSDADFPIESLIAPLVYAFLELRQCPPCWSCQGHLAPDGALRRPPTVWFYARSQVFPGMIGDYVVSLWAKKALAVPWRVTIAYTEPELSAPAYALQPDLALADQPRLAAMQGDIAVIAAGLKDGVRQRTEKLIATMDQYLAAQAKRR